MRSSIRSLLILYLAILGIGCDDRAIVSDPEPLNTRVTIDFSLARGEDPAPFIRALTPRLNKFDFPIRKSELPTGLGQVWVEVQDDNLTETFKAFEQALAETGDSYVKQIFIGVRTSERIADEEPTVPSIPE